MEECVGDGGNVGLDGGGEADVGGSRVHPSVTTFVWGGVSGGLGVCKEVFRFVVSSIVMVGGKVRCGGCWACLLGGDVGRRGGRVIGCSGLVGV